MQDQSTPSPRTRKTPAVTAARAREALAGIEVGGAVELAGGSVAIVRTAEDAFRWTGKRGTDELGTQKAVKRLASCKTEALEDARYTNPEPLQQPATSGLTWTIWAAAEDGGERPVRTFEGSRADGYVLIASEQAKLDPQPLMRLRRGGDTEEDRQRRCILFIHPGGWKTEPTEILRKSRLYRTEEGA